MQCLAVAAAALSVVACGSARSTGAADGSGTAEAGVPKDAIRVDEGRYMVPLEKPVRGCQAYRPHSTHGDYVVAALFYRRPDGSFTIRRDEADCPRAAEDSAGSGG